MCLPGLGDFVPSEISALDDPVPLMDEAADGTLKRKAKTLLYAPMSQIGNVHYGNDDDVYIDLRTVAYSNEATLNVAEDEDVPIADGGETKLVRALHGASYDEKRSPASSGAVSVKGAPNTRNTRLCAHLPTHSHTTHTV